MPATDLPSSNHPDDAPSASLISVWRATRLGLGLIIAAVVLSVATVVLGIYLQYGNANELTVPMTVKLITTDRPILKGLTIACVLASVGVAACAVRRSPTVNSFGITMATIIVFGVWSVFLIDFIARIDAFFPQLRFIQLAGFVVPILLFDFLRRLAHAAEADSIAKQARSMTVAYGLFLVFSVIYALLLFASPIAADITSWFGGLLLATVGVGSSKLAWQFIRHPLPN